MRKLAIVPMIMLTACMHTAEPVAEVSRLNNGYGLSPTDSVNHLSQRIVNSLVKNNDALRFDQPLLVMTPVLLDQLVESNALSLQLQQGMITALHEHQFNLVDANLAEDMKVTKSGEFLLTRDWQQLPLDIAVEHVLVSTMSPNTDGVVINSRIVNVTNNRVVSATQASVLQHELPNYIALSAKVTDRNGLLYRNDKMGMQPVTVVGDKP